VGGGRERGRVGWGKEREEEGGVEGRVRIGSGRRSEGGRRRNGGGGGEEEREGGGGETGN